MATDERKVDYLKSEVITFVVQFCFEYSFIVDYKVNVKVKSRLLTPTPI